MEFLWFENFTLCCDSKSVSEADTIRFSMLSSVLGSRLRRGYHLQVTGGTRSVAQPRYHQRRRIPQISRAPPHPTPHPRCTRRVPLTPRDHHRPSVHGAPRQPPRPPPAASGEPRAAGGSSHAPAARVRVPPPRPQGPRPEPLSRGRPPGARPAAAKPSSGHPAGPLAPGRGRSLCLPSRRGRCCPIGAGDRRGAVANAAAAGAAAAWAWDGAT